MLISIIVKELEPAQNDQKMVFLEAENVYTHFCFSSFKYVELMYMC